MLLDKLLRDLALGAVIAHSRKGQFLGDQIVPRPQFFWNIVSALNVLRALSHVEKFTLGTNLKAWLATIMRIQFYNELRRRARLQLERRLAPESESRADMSAAA